MRCARAKKGPKIEAMLRNDECVKLPRNSSKYEEIMGSAQDRQRRSQAIALRRSIMRCLYGVMAAANLIKSQGPLLHIQNGNAGTQSGQQLVSSTDSGNANVPIRSKTKTYVYVTCQISDIKPIRYQISLIKGKGLQKKSKFVSFQVGICQ